MKPSFWKDVSKPMIFWYPCKTMQPFDLRNLTFRVSRGFFCRNLLLRSKATAYNSINLSSWWLNQPIWKIWVKMGIFPPNSGWKYKNIWVATTQLSISFHLWLSFRRFFFLGKKSATANVTSNISSWFKTCRHYTSKLLCFKWLGEFTH